MLAEITAIYALVAVGEIFFLGIYRAVYYSPAARSIEIIGKNNMHDKTLIYTPLTHVHTYISMY
jgi:hypothetical protein